MSPIKEYHNRIFAGLLLIVMGILFLLANLGKLDIGDVISDYWPLILVFIGLGHVFRKQLRNAGFGLLLIAVGVFFQLDNWGFIGGNFWMYFWPSLLIAVGVWLIFRPGFKGYGNQVPEIKDDDLGAFVLFSGTKRRYESEKFRGGKATALFGGMDLDLTKTKLADNQATVELTAIFGGINLFVPRSWKVVVDSSAILGGVNDKHSPVPATTIQATLYVRATALLGGIDIKN